MSLRKATQVSLAALTLIAAAAPIVSAQVVAYRHRSTVLGDHLAGYAEVLHADGLNARNRALAYQTTIRTERSARCFARSAWRPITTSKNSLSNKSAIRRWRIVRDNNTTRTSSTGRRRCSCEMCKPAATFGLSPFVTRSSRATCCRSKRFSATLTHPYTQVTFAPFALRQKQLRVDA